MRALRIAILTHATDPCGGVAHSLALAEALCALGHEAVVHAPDPSGRGFYRDAACPTVSVAALPCGVPPGGAAPLDRIRRRIDAYLRHFATPAACDFDVFHAQDAVGGNALATLRRRRLIPGFVRTVHRLDRSEDPQLAYLQDRAICEAAQLLCVSRAGSDLLADAHGIRAEVVGAGVDPAVYRPEPDAVDAGIRGRWGLGLGPLVLAVGGVEARRNTVTLVAAFAALRARHPQARLALVGGPGGRDRAADRAVYRTALAGLEVGPGCPVIDVGPVPQADLPALYRAADVLAAPSLAAGAGLCVLEALACGTPAVVSRLPPFTEYLSDEAAVFVEPADPADLARGLAAALEPGRAAALREAGRAVAADHSWRTCAERHLPAYAGLRGEPLEPSPIHA